MAAADKKANKQRPEPLELRTSVPDIPSESLNNASNMSPAELYINQQSQSVFDLNDTQSGSSTIFSSTSSTRHAEKMNEWRGKEVNNIYKNEPYRYKYGSPPSSSTVRRVDCQPVLPDVQPSCTKKK